MLRQSTIGINAYKTDRIEKLWRSAKSMAFGIGGEFNITPFVQVKNTAPFRAAT